MQKERVTRPEIQLIGLSIRTNNEDEMNPQRCKIGELVEHYWTHQIATQIPNRKNPGITFSVYTDYENNEHGNYTYLIGEEVTSFENMPTTFQVPYVVVNAWKEIWKMPSDELGGERIYLADFEIYDERAADLKNTVLDIYIGIK